MLEQNHAAPNYLGANFLDDKSENHYANLITKILDVAKNEQLQW